MAWEDIYVVFFFFQQYFAIPNCSRCLATLVAPLIATDTAPLMVAPPMVAPPMVAPLMLAPPMVAPPMATASTATALLPLLLAADSGEKSLTKLDITMSTFVQVRSRVRLQPGLRTDRTYWASLDWGLGNGLS